MTVTQTQFDEFRGEILGILKALERRLEYLDAGLVIAVRLGKQNSESRGLETSEADDWLRDRETIPPIPEAPELVTVTDHPLPVITDTRQRVLFVDDDPDSRKVVKRVLESAGFAVTLAVDGDQAVSLIAQHGCFDLAIVDQNLGAGMDRGVEVCDQLEVACPDQRLLLLSGAFDIEAEGLAFLPKPWGENEVLVAKVRALLGEGGESE